MYSQMLAAKMAPNFQFQPTPCGAAEQSQYKSMRAASLLSIFSGLFLLALAVAAPAILRWQAENVLSTPSGNMELTGGAIEVKYHSRRQFQRTLSGTTEHSS
jgi:hypothetical protein